MPPIAATVAVGEPDSAPKIIHARMEAQAKPPGIQPISAFAKSQSRLEMPPEDMRLPAIIKNGMAIRVKLSMEVNSFCAQTNRSTLPPSAVASRPPPARQSAMGTLKNRQIKKPINRAAVIMPSPPPHSVPVCHAGAE